MHTTHLVLVVSICVGVVFFFTIKWIDGWDGWDEFKICMTSRMIFAFKNLVPFWVWTQKHYIHLILMIGVFENVENS